MSGFGKEQDKKIKNMAMIREFMDTSDDLQRQAEKKILKEEEARGQAMLESTPWYDGKSVYNSLYYRNHKQWVAEHVNELNDYLYDGKAWDHIAPFAAARMDKIESPSNTILNLTKNSIKKPFNGQYDPADPVQRTAYSMLHPSDIDKVVTAGRSRVIDDIDLHVQHIGRSTSESPHEVVKAIDNILGHEGRSVVWDLETWGSRRANGRNLGQRVTEFSFTDATGNFKDKSYQVNRTMGSVIGIDTSIESEANEVARLRRVIDDYTHNRAVSDGDLVTLNRLALTGSDKTEVNWKDAMQRGDGVIRYSRFADQSEIGMTKEEMLRGLDSLVEIGKFQNQTKDKVSGMYGWEKELLDAMHTVYDNDLTAIGHNTEGFDTFNLDQLAHDKSMTTAAFRAEVNKMTGNRPVAFKYQFDDLQIEKEVGSDSYGMWLKYFGGDKEKTNQLINWMRNNGETMRTQQTILAALNLKEGKDPGFREGAGTHVAEADAIGTLDITYRTGLFDPSSADSLIAEGRTKRALRLKANGTQAFTMLSSSWQPDRYGILTMTKNNMTGGWDTSDGVSINEFGIKQNSFAVGGLQRRGLYTPVGAGMVGEDSAVYKTFAAAHKDMDVSSLMYMKMRAINNADGALGDEVIMFGTPNKVQSLFNSSAVLAGVKKNAHQKEFVRDASVLTQDELDATSMYTFGTDRQLKHKATTFADLVEEATFARNNDSTARVARDKKARLGQQLLNYIGAMDSYARNGIAKELNLLPSQVDLTQTNPDKIERYRNEFRHTLRANSAAIEQSKDYQLEHKYDQKLWDNSLHGFFNWTDPKTGLKMANPSSLENARRLEEYARKNSTLIESSLAYAKDRTGITNAGDFGKAEFQAYYKSAMTALEDRAVAKANSKITRANRMSKGAIGYKTRGRFAAELENTFEVDLNGFEGIEAPEGRIASFNINSGYSMLNTLYRELGVTKEKAALKSESEKIRLLGRFQSFLVNDTGVLAANDERLIDPANDVIDSAGSKLRYQFQAARENNASAGFLMPMEQHTVSDLQYENAGLEDTDIVDVIQQQYNTTIKVAPAKYNKLPGENTGFEKNKEYDSFIDTIAQDINENVIWDDSELHIDTTGDQKMRDAAVEKLMAAGYSERDANTVYLQSKLKKQGTEKFWNNLVGKIYENGGSVGYDKDAGRVWMYNNASAAEADERHYLDATKEVYHDGIFQVETASGSRYVDNVGYYRFGDGSMHWSSIAERYSDSRKGLIDYVLKNGAQVGELDTNVDYILSSLNAEYRNFSSIKDNSSVDRRAANAVNLSEVPTDLYGTSRRAHIMDKLLNEGTQAEKLFVELLNKQNPKNELRTISNIDPNDVAAVIRNSNYIAEILRSTAGEHSELVNAVLGNNLQNIVSHGGDSRLVYDVLRDEGRATENLHVGTNEIDRKLAHATSFNADRASQILDGRGARFGEAFSTSNQFRQLHAADKAIGYRQENTVVYNRLSVRSKDFRELLHDTAKKNNWDTNSQAYRMLGTIYTEEGNGAVSSYMADAVMENNAYEQRISLQSVAEAKETPRSYMSRKFSGTHPNLKFDKEHGTVSFEYTNGVFTSEGEKLFTKSSKNSLFKDTTVRTKYGDGLLRFGVFKDGKLVSQESVNKYLSGYQDELRAAGGDWREKSYQLLSKNYNLNYYVENVLMGGVAKVSDYSEKSASKELVMGLGTGSDKRIKGVLKDLGVEDRLYGMQVGYDTINELMHKKSISGSRFELIVNGIRTAKNSMKKRKSAAQMEALSDREIVAYLNKNGFGSVNEFGVALMKERNEASDLLDQLGVQSGIIRKGEHIEGVFNNYPGKNKHGDATSIDALYHAIVDQKIDAGLGESEAKRYATNRISSVIPGIKWNGSGFSEYSGGRPDLDAYKKLVQESGLTNQDEHLANMGFSAGMKKVRVNGKDVLVEVGKTQSMSMMTMNKGRVSTDGTYELKTDKRTTENMRTSRYSQDYLDGVQERLSAVFGDKQAEMMASELYKGKKAGDLTNQALYTEVREKAFHTEGEAMGGGMSMYRNGAKTNSKKGRAWLAENGLDDDRFIDNTIAGMVKNGAKDVTANKVLEYHTAVSTSFAHEFNRGTGKYSLEDMQQQGFGVLSIEDFDNSARATPDKFANSMYGRAVILDLHSKELERKGAQQLYKDESDRYIALPFTSPGEKDSTGAFRKSEFQAKVSVALNRYNDYVNDYVRLSETPGDANTKRLDRTRQNILEARNKIAALATSKTGVIEKAMQGHFTDGVMTGIAQGFEFYGKDLDGGFSGMQWLDSGKSFSEIADLRNAGKTAFDPDFVIKGLNARNTIYNMDRFMEIAGGDEQLAKKMQEQTFGYLEKHGTIGVTQRQPTQALNNFASTNLHFSSLVGADETKIHALAFSQRNGDFDTDNDTSMVEWVKAKVDWGNGRKVDTRLDYSMYQMALKNGASVKIDGKGFNDAKGHMVQAGFDVNPDADMRNSEWTKNGKAKGDALSTQSLENMTYDGTHTVDYGHEYSLEDERKMRQTWDSLAGRRQEYTKGYREARAAAGASKDDIDDEITSWSKDYISGLNDHFKNSMSEEEYGQAHEAMHYFKWNLGHKERLNNAFSKKSAGVLNTPIFKFQQIMDASGTLSAEESKLLNMGVAAINEGALTGKNTRGEIDLEKPARVSKVFNDAFAAMSRGKDTEQAADNVFNLLYNEDPEHEGIFNGRLTKEFGGRAGEYLNEGKSGLEASKAQAKNTALLMARLVRDTTTSGTRAADFKISISKMGLDFKAGLSGIDDAGREDGGILGQTEQTVNDIGGLNGSKADPFEMHEAPGASQVREELIRSERARQEARAAADRRSSRIRNTTRAASEGAHESLGAAIRSVAGMFKNGGPNGIAAAAIGIAGGLMTAGYVSGPSRHGSPTPATTQASGASADEQDVTSMQQVPSLSDANMNVARGGPKSGYVININAQSPNGQQAAVNAISNAASGMTPQNGSINLSLNTSVTNQITQLQVNRMVAHSIGVA